MIPGLPLEAHDPIQVRISDAYSSELCDSCVEELAADELLIRWPSKGGELVPIRDHQVITISFGRTHRVYEFEATVLDRLDHPIALLAIRPSSPVRSLQRRHDLRVRALVPVALAPKVVGMASFKDKRLNAHHIKTETLTISAGGFAIRHHAPIALGTQFEVKMTLPGDRRHPLAMSAQIIRCTEAEDTEAQPPLYDLGFHFTRISEAARAQIVRFIFSLQREEHLED
jgi:c-di-GMP-binding flagellar brake protein YcgR